MQEFGSGFVFERDLSDAPSGWNIQTDSDFDDNSEIVPTELVACALRSATTPTGIMCDLEADDGSVTTLELVDVTFELTIREATTGAPVATDTIEAVHSRMPTLRLRRRGRHAVLQCSERRPVHQRCQGVRHAVIAVSCGRRCDGDDTAGRK